MRRRLAVDSRQSSACGAIALRTPVHVVGGTAVLAARRRAAGLASG